MAKIRSRSLGVGANVDERLAGQHRHDLTRVDLGREAHVVGEAPAGQLTARGAGEEVVGE